MKILSVKNLHWSDEQQSKFDATVEFEELGVVPYTASLDSPSDYGQEIWANGIAGEYGAIAGYVEPEPEAIVIIIPAVTLWERMTEAEAEQVAEVMATQPFRTRKIFETAATFRSDHELWPLLESMATQLFGEARAAELLAP